MIEDILKELVCELKKLNENLGSLSDLKPVEKPKKKVDKIEPIVEPIVEKEEELTVKDEPKIIDDMAVIASGMPDLPDLDEEEEEPIDVEKPYCPFNDKQDFYKYFKDLYAYLGQFENGADTYAKISSILTNQFGVRNVIDIDPKDWGTVYSKIEELKAKKRGE